VLFRSSHGLPIQRYSPESTGAIAYAALAAELRRRDGRVTQDPLDLRQVVIAS
jgi:hypothetical protein